MELQGVEIKQKTMAYKANKVHGNFSCIQAFVAGNNWSMKDVGSLVQ